MSRAVELDVSLAKVESSFELTDSGEKQLRQTLQHFFKATQTIWNRCGRRRSRVLSKHSSFFCGNFSVSIQKSADSDGDDDDGARQSQGSVGRPAKR